MSAEPGASEEDPGRPSLSWAARASALAPLLLPALVVALPALAALLGSPGPHRLSLNLGPGDGPYVRGFAPSYEIDDKVGTHWTTYHAGLALPLAARGAPISVSYRYARVFGETAQVEVSAVGQTLDRFAARGGVWVERRAPVAAPPGPVRLDIVSDSHERQDRGLKLDWVRFDVAGGGRLVLQGAARWQAALTLALLLAVLRLLGWSVRAAALLVSPWAVAAAAGLWLDPWLTHRLLRGLPLALALFGLTGAVLGRWLHGQGRVEAATLRLLGVLAVSAFLLRALAITHPDFYYPDLRTHAKLVEQLRQDGLQFFLTPSRSIAEHGVWRTIVYGRVHAFPYTPAFHLAFAALRLPYDTLLVAMKLTAAAVSVVPLVLVWGMARRLGASTSGAPAARSASVSRSLASESRARGQGDAPPPHPSGAPPSHLLGAVLMLLVPTYTSRLSFAFLPALFGHAVDMAFLYWLLPRLEAPMDRRTWLTGVAWVVACQLAYVSGVMNVSLLLAVLAAARALYGAAPRGRAALAVLAMGLFGSALSVLLYYRDFVPMAVEVARQAAAGGGASHYPVQSWLAVAYARTRDFFDGAYPPLAALGLVLLRRARGAVLLFAWLATYLLLLLGRARMPDVFLHGHETLFVTPLVCLAAGHALAWMGGQTSWRRALVAAAVGLLAVQGALWQWRALAAQLGNAL